MSSLFDCIIRGPGVFLLVFTSKQFPDKNFPKPAIVSAQLYRVKSWKESCVSWKLNSVVLLLLLPAWPIVNRVKVTTNYSTNCYSYCYVLVLWVLWSAHLQLICEGKIQNSYFRIFSIRENMWWAHYLMGTCSDTILKWYSTL